MTKLLTIAMPCYNVEAYLERGLSSLADNRFANDVEVIVVNDGSTDDTEAIAQRYVDAHPSLFRLVNKENGGHGSGINTGLAHATGTYFRILDGDDWVDADQLALWISAVRGVEADIIADVRTEIDMATGAVVAKTQLPAQCHAWTPRQTGEAAPLTLEFDDVAKLDDIENHLSIHTLAVRTALLREHALRVTEKVFYEDSEYVVKATCLAHTICFLDTAVYQYLVGNANQSVAAQVWADRYLHHEQVIRALLEFERSPEVRPAMQSYLRMRIELLLNTHYNVLLVFDGDRARGRRRAKQFRAWLEKEHPAYARATAKRYRLALALNLLGIDRGKLDRLMGRR